MGSDGGPPDPDEAFELLGDPMRTSILREVWAAPADRVTFSALRERLGGPDSGRFNYHLNRLVGHFLTRGEDGYGLTQAGREVVRAVMAGSITRRPRLEPVEIGAACPACGGQLVVEYDDYASIRCGECGTTVMWNEFPPAGLEGRTPEGVARAFDRWVRSRFGLAADGVCPNCAHAMTTRVHDRGADSVVAIASVHRCGNCRYEARVPLIGHVLTHPAAIAFYRGVGTDLAELPFWRMWDLAAEMTVEVVGTEPTTLEVSITHEDRGLRMRFDGDLGVLDVERRGP